MQLGHSNPQTTTVYAQVLDEEVTEAVEKLWYIEERGQRWSFSLTYENWFEKNRDCLDKLW